MKHICFEVQSTEELLIQIDELLKKYFASIKKSLEEDTLMTRQQVADYFSVSLPTLHSWMRMNILPYYRIGSKVKFKKKEVLAALRPSRGSRSKN